MTGFNQIERVRRTPFSRIRWKPSNLLKSIEYYQSKNVWLWFGKQQMWVRDKSDISTQIMISVLTVMSQYEIELLTARGMDGKISAIRSHGIHIGGFTPYRKDADKQASSHLLPWGGCPDIQAGRIEPCTKRE